MTIEPPAPGEPRRPDGPRDSGDAWVVADTGERYWGRYGAAGLLAYDPARGVLLQHRVSWSHHGGTWALPGGARHEGESAADAALREAGEEAGVPAGSVLRRLESVYDIGIWSYATVVADVIAPFEPVISDPESRALEWVPLDRVESYPLHPGFAASWAALRALLEVRPVIVVDVANVVGSVPDGWWRDRAGAARRLIDALVAAGVRGVPGEALDVPGDRWHPEIVAVVEGAASAASDAAVPGVRVVAAPGSGDDAIAAEAGALAADGRAVTVVTSDRGLRERAEAAGVTVRSVSWLRDLL